MYKVKGKACVRKMIENTSRMSREGLKHPYYDKTEYERNDIMRDLSQKKRRHPLKDMEMY